jgi:LAO/AO transport system kinase
LSFVTTTEQSGIFAARREKQNLGWLDQMIEQQIKMSFVNDPRVKKALPELRTQVQKGELPATIAAQRLVSLFHEKH